MKKHYNPHCPLCGGTGNKSQLGYQDPCFCYEGSAPKLFDGLVSEPILYNRVLSDEEIERIYEAQGQDGIKREEAKSLDQMTAREAEDQGVHGSVWKAEMYIRLALRRGGKPLDWYTRCMKHAQENRIFLEEAIEHFLKDAGPNPASEGLVDFASPKVVVKEEAPTSVKVLFKEREISPEKAASSWGNASNLFGMDVAHRPKKEKTEATLAKQEDPNWMHIPIAYPEIAIAPLLLEEETGAEIDRLERALAVHDSKIMRALALPRHLLEGKK